MSRLFTLDIADATGDAAALFAGIKQAFGMVPNAYATIGSNSPALLAQILQLNAVLQKGSLSKKELEAINLSISEHTECDYCVAAHTLMAKGAGYSGEQARLLRSGAYPDDARLDALVKFALLFVETSGTLPQDAIDAVRQAGYSDQQIVEAIGAISAILLTNMINRANDTTLDFPKPD